MPRSSASSPMRRPPAVDIHREIDKGHGRIEERSCRVSRQIDWLSGDRRFPGEYRFEKLATIAMIEATVETKARAWTETALLHHLAAAPAEQLAEAVRDHWRIENALHWVLDVTFREDLARVRKGHGAKTWPWSDTSLINIVRTANDKRSLKTRRKLAGWEPRLPRQRSSPLHPVNPDSEPWPPPASNNLAIAPKSGIAPKISAYAPKGSDRRISIGYGPRTKKVPRHQYSRSKSWEDFIKQRCRRLDDERLIAKVSEQGKRLALFFSGNPLKSS